MPAQSDTRIRFGQFEIDPDAGELKRDGQTVRLAPQPFRLLVVLVARAGKVVTREEIRREIWGNDTFVDFTQGVNFSIKQIREALGDSADQPVYVQTVPKRGYRFIAAIDTGSAGVSPPVGRPWRGVTDINLHKALWANIAEIRLAQQRRRRVMVIVLVLLTAAGTLLAVTRLM